MLAASPSLSPSSFTYSASGKVQRSKSMHSSYPSSPRFTASSSPKGTPVTGISHPASPPPRANYRDASTQYSPMNDLLREPIQRAPTKSQSHLPEDYRRSEQSSPTNSAPNAIPQSTTAFAPVASKPNAPEVASRSPSTKRRQLTGSVDSGSGSSPVPSSPQKRPKASKGLPKVLPLRYELCDIEDLVILIADMISELIETNDNLPLRDVVLTRFHSRTPPGISVIDYLQRLAKHAALTPPLLLSMVYYIDRLCSLYPAFTITTLTVHRFLIAAATVAAKGLSDSFWNNSTYARVGGIKIAELGLLELELLYRVDWRIVPKPETLVEYYHGLIGRTDAYVLESDSCARSTAEEQQHPEPEMEVEKGSANGSDRRDTKWEEWMKDVADSGNK